MDTEVGCALRKCFGSLMVDQIVQGRIRVGVSNSSQMDHCVTFGQHWSPIKGLTQVAERDRNDVRTIELEV